MVALPARRIESRIPVFRRTTFSGREPFSRIGQGRIGGKAHGLFLMQEMLEARFPDGRIAGLAAGVPRSTVITTDFFDRFMDQNDLYEVALSDMSDERIAHHFMQAVLPADLTGDLMALSSRLHTPLAVRSSSLLEDSLRTPFAGIYQTKMTPNNQPDADSRFHRLVEAVKFVYASTFFRAARAYARGARVRIEDEKMAVILQEVAGVRHDVRFYPNVSGVARSYNAYPFGHAEPEDGIVNLALGLGKQIVDGGLSWSYSPAYPEANPPVGSVRELLDQTQISFWTVNMGRPPAHDPIREAEYLLECRLEDADYDNTLRDVASTYDAGSDRLRLGTAFQGARVVNFAPLLHLGEIPLNPAIRAFLAVCEETVGGGVEVEFAMTVDRMKRDEPYLHLLQVRETARTVDDGVWDDEDSSGGEVLLRSQRVMGSGLREDIRDVVYLRRDTFDFKDSRAVADRLEAINRGLEDANTPYVLIGFGRWGSSDPWLGIPVTWGQVSGAGVIVEATLPERRIDPSQGAHFFHNILNLGVLYLTLDVEETEALAWDFLNRKTAEFEADGIRHVRLEHPLSVRVSSGERKGIIVI